VKEYINSFVIADPDKCIGCRACEIACAAKHRKNNSGGTIGTMNNEVVPRLFLVKGEHFTMPVQCRHCTEALCVNVCPVKAIVENDGIIFVQEDKCIGCKNCMLVCTVGAVNLLPRIESQVTKGRIKPKVSAVAYKCDLCIEEGKKPTCIEECLEEALKLVKWEENKDYNGDCNIKKPHKQMK